MSNKQMDEIEPEEYCDIAIEQAFRLCKDEELAFKSIAKCYGFAEDMFADIGDLKSAYLGIIDQGIDKEDLESVSRWVIAKAWQSYTDDKHDLIESFQSAWSAALEIWYEK